MVAATVEYGSEETRDARLRSESESLQQISRVRAAGAERERAERHAKKPKNTTFPSSIVELCVENGKGGYGRG